MSRRDYPSPKTHLKVARGFPGAQLDLQICKPFEVSIGILQRKPGLYTRGRPEPGVVVDGMGAS